MCRVAVVRAAYQISGTLTRRTLALFDLLFEGRPSASTVTRNLKEGFLQVNMALVRRALGLAAQ